MDDTEAAWADPPTLLAYLHLRPGTPQATRGLLRDYITGFAEREGYRLTDVLIGSEGTSEQVTVRSLIEQVRQTGAHAVLVTGPAQRALVALHQLAGVRVLTLADVSPTHYMGWQFGVREVAGRGR